MKEHDEQVADGKEHIPILHETEIGQEVGGDVRQRQNSIRHDLGGFLNLLEPRFRVAAPPTTGSATGGDLETRH